MRDVEKRLCGKTNASGKPCRGVAREPSGICAQHDPIFQAEKKARETLEKQHYLETMARWKAESERHKVEMRERERWLKRRRLMRKSETLLTRKNATEADIAQAKALLELVRALEVSDPYANEVEP